ncbi:ESPR-type extended signal peptide-containing protein, partial [Vreelandella zhaodongensis]
MNNVFRLIWNRTLGRLVVTSEAARSRDKAATRQGVVGQLPAPEVASNIPALLRPVVAAVALAVGSIALVSPVQADALMNADSCANQGFNNTRIGIGSGAKACTDGVIAIGWGAEATGVNLFFPPNPDAQSGIAIGRASSATGGVAIGHRAAAGGSNSDGTSSVGTAIGGGSVARGHRSIAIGTVGNRPTVASANWAMALGTNATASGVRSVALGSEAKAKGVGSLAMGDGAVAEAIVVSTQALNDAPTSNPNGYEVGDDLPTTAVGSGATATSGTAIGHDAVAGRESGNGDGLINTGTALGAGAQATGNTSIAISPAAYAPAIADGLGAIAMGYDTRANELGSLAIGIRAEAAEAAMAFGYGAKALGKGGSALGGDAKATGNRSVAIGAAEAAKAGDIAIGDEAYAEGGVDGSGNPMSALAVGFSAEAVGDDAAAFGNNAKARANYGLAVGNFAEANGVQASSLGNGAQANGDYSLALGNIAKANGVSASSVGNFAEANGDYSLALGEFSEAGGSRSTAVGSGAKASAENAWASGSDAVASANGAIALGKQSQATVENTVAMGTNAEASATNAIAIGKDSLASGVDTGAIGRGAVATGSWAVGTGANASNGGQAFGEYSKASGNVSSAYGYAATATGARSSALGTNARAEGARSVAAGDGATARGNSFTSILIGNGSNNVNGYSNGDPMPTVALGAGAESYGTAVGLDAQGGRKLANGSVNTGTALGAGAQALGNTSIAISAVGSGAAIAEGRGAIAQGFAATASKNDSIAIGSLVKANGENSIAMGLFAESKGPDNLTLGRNASTGNVTSGVPDAVDLAGGSQIAIGTRAKTDTAGSIAVGYEAETGVSQNFGIALGGYAKGTGNSAVAIGRRATASGQNAIATGIKATASARNALATGNTANATGERAIAIGTESLASVDDTIAVGTNARATGVDALAIGRDAWAAGSVAQGAVARAANGGAAFGDGAQATWREDNDPNENPETFDVSGAALGKNALANRSGAAALGANTEVLVDDGVALGSGSISTVGPGVDGYIPATADAAQEQAILDTAAVRGAVDVGSRQITSVAAGTQDDDAVNVSQLKAVETMVADSGVNYYSVNDNGTQQGNFNNDGATGRNSLAAGTNAVASKDYAVAVGDGAEAIGFEAIAIGREAVASGRDSSIALGQLSEASGNFAIAIGRGAAAEEDNSVALGNGAISMVEQGVALGSGSLASVGSGVAGYIPEGADAADEQAILDTIATRGSVDVGSRQITRVAAGTEDGDAVNVSQLKSVSNIANAGWDLTANGEATGENIAPGESADFSQGQNIAITRTGNSIEVATADDVEFTNVDITENLTVEGETKLGDNFFVNNEGNVTYTGDITEGDQITNKTYVDNSVNELGDTPLTFMGDSGTEFERRLGETTNVKGGAEGGLTEGNIGVVADGTDTLNIQLAENIDLGEDGSVVMGDTTVNNDGLTIVGGPSITNTGIDAGGTQITNVAAGTEGDHAVNLDQLISVEDIANAGWYLSANGEGVEDGFNIAPGEAADFEEGQNIAITRDGNKINVATADDVEFSNVNVTNQLDVAGDTNIGGNTTIEGDTTVKGDTFLGDNFSVVNNEAFYTGPITENTHIVNKEYVDGGIDDLASTPITFGGDTGTTDRKLGDELNIVTSNANLSTEVTDDETLVIALSDDLDVNNVTVNDSLTVNGPTTLNGGTTIGDSLTLQAGTTVNMGGNQITNVAAGTEGDHAVNLDQLTDVSDVANKGWNVQTNGDAATNVAPGDTVQMIDGKNIAITRDGQDITVATADDVEFTNVDITENLTVEGETRLGDNFFVNNEGNVTYTGDITEGDHITNKSYVDNSVTEL